ncbi:Protein nessun dorma [Frankliniella fusca]|uniref:Protein nessun dorma n=1 Tax=Frankliniella fusca TaxID=407009 RepID=A0AAE1GZC0_9NEOP|nr:Protein nessun dorma [Frankliniella fusca]
MSELIFSFIKTYEQRLEEYRDILNSVSASEVVQAWVCTLETFIEPTGWQALWKISRRICEELDIMFPKLVFVKVVNVNFEELTAFVEVEKVQEDISIPLRQEVPLLELYPTKHQDELHLNVEYTANFIDRFRFFYNHIWCPWDIEDGDTGDWSNKYLESRLQLFFEMNNGVIPPKVADKMHQKKEMARCLYERKQEIEELLHKTEGDVDAENISSTLSEKTYELMQLHLQVNPLITELQLFENPSMRKLIIKKFFEEEEKSENNSTAIIVWNGGLVDSFINYAKICKEVLDADTHSVCASSLESAFDLALSGNTIMLPEGLHHVNLILEFNLSIIGGVNSTPEIAAKKSNNFLFNVRNAQIKFSNLKLSANIVANVLQLLKGSSVEMRNCVITDGGSKDGRGIVVNSGASILLDGCKFYGLHVALCCLNGSQVNIRNTSFENCAYGIEVYENSDLSVSMISIKNCKGAGFFVSQFDGKDETGSIELLSKSSSNMAAPGGPGGRVLFDFQAPSASVSDWVEQSDVVRSVGMSKAALVLQRTQQFQRAVFFTLLNPQPNGAGFAGMRTFASPGLDLGAHTKLVLSCRGQGQNFGYKVVLRHRGLNDEPNPTYEQMFRAPSEGEFASVELPFKDFLPYYRGRQVEAIPLDTSNITSVELQMYGGVYLATKQAGASSLEINWISAE